MYQSILREDQFVVLASVMLGCVMLVLGNLMADILLAGRIREFAWEKTVVMGFRLLMRQFSSARWGAIGNGFNRLYAVALFADFRLPIRPIYKICSAPIIRRLPCFGKRNLQVQSYALVDPSEARYEVIEGQGQG